MREDGLGERHDNETERKREEKKKLSGIRNSPVVNEEREGNCSNDGGGRGQPANTREERRKTGARKDETRASE